MKKITLALIATFVLAALMSCATTGKNYGLGAFDYDKKPLAAGETVVGSVEAKTSIYSAESANPKYRGFEEMQTFINDSLTKLLSDLNKEAINQYGEKATLRNIGIVDSYVFVSVTNYYTAKADVVISK